MKILSPKTPSEIVPITFDFSALTATVSSPNVSVTVLGNGKPDAMPSAILDGAPVLSGAQVQQWVSAGVAGANYVFQCSVHASDGARYELHAQLPVRAE